jgi:hypothetical protein
MVGVVLGVPIGMILTTVLAGVIPLFVALPGGGARCSKCHELHGGLRYEDIKTDGWIHLTGDVPHPVWIETARLFETHRIDDLPGVGLLDLLAEYGCDEFRRIVLISLDGGHVAIASQDLTDSARLVPHLGAARFADERLHSSAWLRAIVEVCVVGDAPAIDVEGQETTFGALLAGDRMTAVTEPARVMQTDESTGRTYRNVASRLVTGVPVTRLIDPACLRVRVMTSDGALQFDAGQIGDAVLGRDEHEGHLMLVLPGRSRSAWPVGVTAIACE